MYLKEGVCYVGCDCYDLNSGPCPDYMGKLPIPGYFFPQWVPQCHGFVQSPDLDGLHVFHCNNVASSDLHILSRSGLDQLGRERHESPAPMYHNIIDHNVAAVDEIWIPAEF